MNHFKPITAWAFLVAGVCHTVFDSGLINFYWQWVNLIWGCVGGCLLSEDHSELCVDVNEAGRLKSLSWL